MTVRQLIELFRISQFEPIQFFSNFSCISIWFKTCGFPSMLLHFINERTNTAACIQQCPCFHSRIFFNQLSFPGNCNFSYKEGSADVIVLHVEQNVKILIDIAAFLVKRDEAYSEVAKMLGVEAPAFTWNGYNIQTWLEDIKLRINKIQIASKKAKFEALEERLNKIISPELRAKMELEVIANELRMS